MTIDPRALLHRRHRLAVWQRPLWIVVAALGVDAVLACFSVDVVVRAWTLAGALVAALVVRLFFHPSLRDIARALDVRAQTHNRLEALVALENRADPLARAIGDETGSHLARKPLPRPYPWMGGVVLLAALLALQLATLDLSATRSTARERAAIADASSAPAPDATKVEPPPPPTPMPRALLRWVEPQAGITATVKETIPLLAESDSAVALTKLNLRLTLAGEPAPPISQTDGVAAGTQSIPVALDLARLDSRPFAFVTYHLSAERVREKISPTTPPWTEIFSPLQVIQIRAVGSDLELEPPPEDDAAQSETEILLFHTKRLKLAQIVALKSVFAVAHEPSSASDSEQPGRVQAVATQERAVWQDASALVALLEKNSEAATALEFLRQAQSEIQAAWDDLARAEPAAAFAPADRGLARIADVERVLSSVVEKIQHDKHAAETATAPTNAPDENETFVLPPREETPAGRLEALAREQQELADQLAQGTAHDAFARQDRIARALPKLAADPHFPPAIASAITAASVDAAEAAHHLNDRDPRAATEPATRAAQTLQAIGAALDAAGRARVAEELADAQRKLNHAALAVNDGEVADAAREFASTREELREEAVQQQQYGSATAAQQLGDMSNAMDESKLNPELDRLAKQSATPASPERAAAAEKLTQLAQRAASARKQAQTEEERAKALARAAEELRRASANADRAAQAGDHEMEDLFEKAQENAQQGGASLPLPPQSSGSEGSGSNSTEGRNTEYGGNSLSDTPMLRRYGRDLSEQIRHAIELLAEEQRQMKRTQVLTTATPAEAPPAYRPAVADYFESLARANSSAAAAPLTSAP